jgi:ABC-2 type transport system ATP-binding protein
MLRLADLVQQAGGRVELRTDESATVSDIDTAKVGEIAASNGLILHELSTRRPSLEDAFVELTHDTSDLIGSLS